MLCDISVHEEDANEVNITDDEMSELNRLSKTKDKDATFIRLLLQFMYKDNLHVLKTARSFTGRSRKTKKTTLNDEIDSPQKTEFKAISPMKKKIIFSLFKNRVEKSGVSKQETFTRISSTNLSQLVSKAISNLRLQCKPPILVGNEN